MVAAGAKAKRICGVTELLYLRAHYLGKLLPVHWTFASALHCGGAAFAATFFVQCLRRGARARAGALLSAFAFTEPGRDCGVCLVYASSS